MRVRTIDWQSSASAQKASLRAESAALRRNVWLACGARARLSLADRGVTLIAAMPGVSAVAGYFPLRDELDPLPLLQALHSKGVSIVLPATEPGPALVFMEWVPGSPLNRGKFGLQEPGSANPELRPNLVLVPSWPSTAAATGLATAQAITMRLCGN